MQIYFKAYSPMNFIKSTSRIGFSVNYAEMKSSAADHRLYCSEFVYKVNRQALHDTACFKVSYGFSRRYIGIDELFLTSSARFVYRIDY